MSQSSDNKIKDNPTLVKMREDVSNLVTVSKVVAIFEKLGIRNDKISEAMTHVSEMAQLAAAIDNVPDNFNERFSKLGWIAHEGMSLELMQQAIKLADESDMEGAEQLLVSHYDEQTIQLQLMRMRFIPEFRPREGLLRKALEDFVAGRYYACVPVVLANIDGLVNDIQQKGFFSKDADLTAWDSIAGHSSGLQQLARLFSKTRMKTTTEQIIIPYRHGIMHGRDLNYDNKIVAAKAWAALFAVGEWAIDVRKPPPESEPKFSFREWWQGHKSARQEIELLKAWKARELVIGVDMPANGPPQAYPERTPERALAEFLSFWAKKNYGKMAALLSSFDQLDTTGTTAGWIRQMFDKTILCDFSLFIVEDRAPAVAIIEAKIVYRRSSNDIERKKHLRIWLSCQDPNGKRVACWNPTGAWRIEMAAFREMLNEWADDSGKKK